MKFEIGRELIENFGKFEKPSSKFLKIGKLEDFQMNDTSIFKGQIEIGLAVKKSRRDSVATAQTSNRESDASKQTEKDNSTVHTL